MYTTVLTCKVQWRNNYKEFIVLDIKFTDRNVFVCPYYTSFYNSHTHAQYTQHISQRSCTRGSNMHCWFWSLMMKLGLIQKRESWLCLECNVTRYSRHVNGRATLCWDSTNELTLEELVLRSGRWQIWPLYYRYLAQLYWFMLLVQRMFEPSGSLPSIFLAVMEILPPFTTPFERGEIW